MNLRLVIFIAAGIEAAIWLAAVIWAGQQPRKPDISVFHGTFFFFVLPAVALALWGALAESRRRAGRHGGDYAVQHRGRKPDGALMRNAKFVRGARRYFH